MRSGSGSGASSASATAADPAALPRVTGPGPRASARPAPPTIRTMRSDEHPAGGAATGGEPDRAPMFQVVAGHPAHEEIAALAAALALKRAESIRAATPARPPAGGWADRRRQLRVAPVPGPDAWHRSGLPR